MESISVGWLSILPPVVAIILALLTKEVISSLLVGILIGAATYSYTVGTGFVGIFTTTFTLMGDSLAGNITNVIFLSLLGALVVQVTVAGGAQAYGVWAATKIKSRVMSQLATALLGVIIFIDDYFNCLAVGTIMKPITDKYQVSRVKLAYFIDSTAAPICIIAPVSSWVAAVGSSLGASGVFDSDMAAFLATIPFNLYALLTIAMVIVLATTNVGFGPMRKFERLAEEGNLASTENDAEMGVKICEKGKVMDLVIPILSLIIFSVLGMLYTGGLFTGESSSVQEAFGNCNSSLSLVLGSFAALVVAFVMYLPRKLMTFNEFFEGVTQGAKNMVMPNIILTLAWTIGAVCRQLLSTGQFVGHMVEVSHFPLAFLPILIFVVSSALAFATGTAWGTFGILIPIVIIVLEPSMATQPNLMTVSLAAVLGGSIFGDHCSPISDTTIMSSTGAACVHLDHVSTQIPYALTTASCCIIGYIAAALSNYSVVVTLLAGFGSLFLELFLFNKYFGNGKVKA
ncbi:Na+/H+ antiporter NhaC family protein [Sinanaerobacter sp. ZZT-01]|uniref:Na+/H+ antiporter NhaC family protein n=1 Tax=Sinanaerobacter sp. ZZT-01 TaxID=3111540 RepID=UPI002D781B55|nr:Na+/H+ antiporter NhaC family protein [Sinanaerobacter sp. ZZT-01]WRR94850.1 Na+/H+ antiporter NhaC family protein [Sinanaerobacter sp. ZZT-01]